VNIWDDSGRLGPTESSTLKTSKKYRTFDAISDLGNYPFGEAERSTRETIKNRTDENGNTKTLLERYIQ
jgi:hypothetical protein